MVPSRSHHEAFTHTLPAACKLLILRRALLTVGSPNAYCMNKGKFSHPLAVPKSKRNPQKVLLRVWTPALLLQSGPVSSGWAAQHSWSPYPGIQFPSSLSMAHTLPAQAQTRGVLFCLELQLLTQPAE